MKLILAFMFSLFLAWGYVANTNSLLSPTIMITARSTSTRLPWQISPRPSMPASVTPCEGSSTAEVPGSSISGSDGDESSKYEGKSEAENSTILPPDSLRYYFSRLKFYIIKFPFVSVMTIILLRSLKQDQGRKFSLLYIELYCISRC